MQWQFNGAKNSIANQFCGDKIMKTIAFTGHRPDKCGGWDNKFEHTRIVNIIAKELQITSYTDTPHLTIISGGALGVDQFAIEAVNIVRPYTEAIHLVIAEPFPFFQMRWPKKSRDKYSELFKTAQEAIVVTTTIDLSDYKQVVIALQKRNEYMVDQCDELWAWWDGSDGGTANCVKYAKKVGKPVRNLFEEYQNNE